MERQNRKTNRPDGWFFRCRSKNCRIEIGIRRGTFFGGSKLRVGQILMLKYYFVKGETNLKSLKRKTNIKEEKTIIDWLSFCREICAVHFELNPIIFGGPNCIVEVDETHLVKRKYNQGHYVMLEFFGAYETEKKLFLFTVLNCTREAIYQFIFCYNRIGSIIYSDEAQFIEL